MVSSHRTTEVRRRGGWGIGRSIQPSSLAAFGCDGASMVVTRTSDPSKATAVWRAAAAPPPAGCRCDVSAAHRPRVGIKSAHGCQRIGGPPRTASAGTAGESLGARDDRSSTPCDTGRGTGACACFGTGHIATRPRQAQRVPRDGLDRARTTLCHPISEPSIIYLDVACPWDRLTGMA
jgi:hypothetical protein